jgi:transcriptional regulator with XRE-family HTH domain
MLRLSYPNVSPMSHLSPSSCTIRSTDSKHCRISQQPVHNRIMAALAHCPRYAFKGGKRLAQDCGVSPAAISRIVTGQSSPSYALVVAITKALEKRIGKRIDPRELVSPDGTYPTPSICELMGCKGCLPSEAFDEVERLKGEYSQLKPGSWSGSVRPKRNGKEAR